MSNNNFFNNATNSFTSERIAAKNENAAIEPSFLSVGPSYNQAFNHEPPAFTSYGGYNQSVTNYPNSSCSTFSNSSTNMSSNNYSTNVDVNTPVASSERVERDPSTGSTSSGSNLINNTVVPFEISEYLGLAMTENSAKEPVEDSDKESEVQPTKKRRKSNHRKLIDKKSKEARNSGNAGIGRKGLIKAREMKEGCGNCRFKCADKISLEDRKKAFKDFWALGDHAEQWKRITELSYNRPKTDKREEDSDSDFEDDNDKKTRRGDIIRRRYTLPSKDGLVFVCKKMFCHTLRVSETWIKTALGKVANGEELTDMRGKHKNRPSRVADDLKIAAREHIEKFPLFESWHYTGDSTQNCLEEGLSVAKMYELYEEKQNAEGKQVVNKHMFRDIVGNVYKYNVFVNPGKEKCEQCEKYNALEPHEKTRQVEEKQCIHSHNKNVLKDMAKSDKQRATEDHTFCAANFNLPRLVALPKTNSTDLLYYSKLCTYNLTIFELASFSGRCNLWTEITGRREPKEVASLILQFLYNKYVTGVKEFSLYSKPCKGLNRNKLFISMLVKASNDLQIKVTHRFLEKGHTNYGCQAIQAKIEYYCGRKNIHTPQEFAKMIWDSKSDPKYTVEEKRQEDIYDFQELSEKFNLDMIDMEDLKEVVVEPNKMTIGIKYVIDQVPTQIKIFKKNVSIKDVKDYRLKNAYDGKLPLSDRKKKDFAAMVEKNLIPYEFKHFYSSIAL